MERYFITRSSAVERIVAERRTLIKDQEQGATARGAVDRAARIEELSKLLHDVRAGRSTDVLMPTAGGGRVHLLVTAG
jgi:hypothetical protein